MAVHLGSLRRPEVLVVLMFVLIGLCMETSCFKLQLCKEGFCIKGHKKCKKEDCEGMSDEECHGHCEGLVRKCKQQQLKLCNAAKEGFFARSTE